MSTHGCFAVLFPHTHLMKSDDGAQEPDATTGDYYHEIPGGFYFYIEPADQEQFRRFLSRRPCLFRSELLFVFAFLRHLV